jgi:hypothetical protein
VHATGQQKTCNIVCPARHHLTLTHRGCTLQQAYLMSVSQSLTAAVTAAAHHDDAQRVLHSTRQPAFVWRGLMPLVLLLRQRGCCQMTSCQVVSKISKKTAAATVC